MFADEIVAAADAAGGEPLIMLQDYHLYLARRLRARAATAGTAAAVRAHSLARSRLLATPAVGDATVDLRRHARQRHRRVPDAGARSVVHVHLSGVCAGRRSRLCGLHQSLGRGRRIEVRTYPISIDAAAVRQTAYSKEARSHDRYLPNHWNEFTVLRVDRAEPSKNIVRGFQAFDRFLEAHRDFQGRVNFVAITVPSRMDVVEYQDYLDDVSAVVGRINAKYANVETGWQPIHLIMGENYPRALAAMKWYDVLLVNSIIDGMNLVAKEGALLNERNGVLILSEGAGAVSQLGEHAIVIGPTDVEGTAEAIHRALTMPLEERRRRAEGLRRAVERDDVTKWFENQVGDMLRFGEGLSQPEPEFEDEELPSNIVPLTGGERVSTTGA